MAFSSIWSVDSGEAGIERRHLPPKFSAREAPGVPPLGCIGVRNAAAYGIML